LLDLLPFQSTAGSLRNIRLITQ